MNELDMTGYALRIRGLKKQYRLGEISGKTLQEEWHRWWALRRGEADPLSKIGENTVFLKGVVSRKKQMVPALSALLG